MNKIAVIGCGNVGFTIIYGLMTLNTNLEVTIIDNDKEKILSNISDLNHSLSITKVKLGDYEDLNQCETIVITAGIKPISNRTKFLKESYKMINIIMENINKTKFNGNIIVVSNPNDVLTTYVSKNYLYPNKVIGTGTMLDQNRLKYYLSEKYQVNPNEVQGMVIGEHGKCQKVLWNTIKIKNIEISLLEEEKKIIEEKVINIANEIVKKKGYTNYGIASCVINILEKILNNETFKLIGSFYNKELGISYSYPLLCKDKEFSYDCDYNFDINFCVSKIKHEYFIFQNNKVIGIDLDDTITNIQEEMKKYAAIFDKENNGKGIVDVNKYLVGEMYGWTDELKDKFFLTYRRKIIKEAKIRKNVSKIFHKWQGLGYKIVIITARNSRYYNNPYQDTYAYLVKHHVPFDELIVNVGLKKDICLKYKVDYFVDDMPNNCMQVNEIENIKVFIMDNGNNYCDDKNIIRIKNFEDMDKVINDV